MPWDVLPDYHCFGCSPRNPRGLRLRFWPHGDGLQTVFRGDRTAESYPGVVHGGLVAAVCDETMGNLLVLRSGLTAFTVSLRMKFIAPLVVGREYRCVARLRDPDASGGAGPPGGAADAGGGLVQTAAEVLGADGAPMATAAATYRPVPMSRARRHLDLDDLAADLLDRVLSDLTGAPDAGSPSPRRLPPTTGA